MTALRACHDLHNPLRFHNRHPTLVPLEAAVFKLANSLHRTPASFRPEFRLVATCTLRPQSAAVQWREQVIDLAHRVTDWSAVLSLVRRHQVYNLVYEVLRELARQTRVPEEVLENLGAFARRSRMDGLLRLGEARRIAEHFQRAAIPVLQLKGAPLSERLYADALMRHSMDIDVLVPAAALPDAADILRRLGYTHYQQQSPVLPGRLERYTEHHWMLHNRANVSVELHWRLGHYSGVHTDRLVAQSLPDTTMGLSVLPPTAELAYLVVHGTSHYWSRLKWLSDVKQALLNLPALVWQDFIAECVACGAQAAAEVTNGVLATVFDTPSAQLPTTGIEQPRHLRSVRYALYRMQGPVEIIRDIRSAVDRTLYRLDCASTYDKVASALRIVRKLTARHP